MAWNDLTPEVQEGLTYAASLTIDPATGAPYANGRLYLDSMATSEGQMWLKRKIDDRKARRAAKLEAAANAALAAAVDAAPEG